MTVESNDALVMVDEGLCAASGMCTRIAPQVFRLEAGDEVAAVVMAKIGEPDLAALAREAEGTCPAMAITVE